MDTVEYIKLNNKIEQMSSSGGHTIENASGTALTQRDTLQFKGGLRVSDDSTNEVTVVDDTNFVGTRAEWEALSTAEQNQYDTVDILEEDDEYTHYNTTAYGLTIDLYRKGNVALITLVGTTTQLLDWRNIILEFPQGYEPIAGTIFPLIQYVEGGGKSFVTNIVSPNSSHPNGCLSGNIGIASGTAVQGSCTYICQ